MGQTKSCSTGAHFPVERETIKIDKQTKKLINSGKEYYEEEWSRVRVMMRNGKARPFWYEVSVDLKKVENWALFKSSRRGMSYILKSLCIRVRRPLYIHC